MKRAAALFACASVLSACFADLLVAPEANVAPSFNLSVSSVNDVQRSYSVGAFLRRGSDENGDPRVLLDATLHVGDSVVQPLFTRDESGLFYTWATSSMVALDSIRLRTPIVADPPGSGVTLALRIPQRGDALLANHVLGEDLEVMVSPAGDTIAGLLPVSANWYLELRTPRVNGTLFRIDGRGRHPPSLRIPAEFIPLEVGDSLVVSLLVFEVHRTVAAPYPVGVSMLSNLVWHRRVVLP